MKKGKLIKTVGAVALSIGITVGTSNCDMDKQRQQKQQQQQEQLIEKRLRETVTYDCVNSGCETPKDCAEKAVNDYREIRDMKINRDDWADGASSTKAQNKNFNIARTFAKKHRHKIAKQDTAAIEK